jgi:hypothetical protein
MLLQDFLQFKIVEKARQDRESSSFLYRKDLNTISKVSVHSMDLLRHQLQTSVWREQNKQVSGYVAERPASLNLNVEPVRSLSSLKIDEE